METIKKLSVVALAVIMTVCFIPAMAFADTTTSVSTATELQDAIDAGTSSIELSANITGNITIGKDENVTIDMNGKTITGSVTVEYDGTFNTEDGGSIIANAEDTAAVFNSGTATLDDGITLDRNTDAGTYYTVVNHGTMTIGAADDADSVIVKTNDQTSSLIENGYYSYSSGKAVSGYVEDSNSKYPTLTIKDGTFTGGISNVKNDDGGYVTINGGTFSGPAEENVLNWNVAKILGGTFTVDTSASTTQGNINNNSADDYLDQGSLTVSGGNFNANPAIVSTVSGGVDFGTITVTGGTFVSTDAIYDTSSTRSTSGVTVDTDSISQASTIDSQASTIAALKKTLAPSKTSILKLYKGKGKFTAKWYKITDATGYELKYSTSKKFSATSTNGTHIKYIKTYKTTKITFNKYVKSNKTYYVKIRTYKQYNGKKYYSGWSSVKKVKTK